MAKKKQRKTKERSKTKIKVKSQQRTTSKFNALFIGIFRGFSGGGHPPTPKCKVRGRQLEGERESDRGAVGGLPLVWFSFCCRI